MESIRKLKQQEQALNQPVCQTCEARLPVMSKFCGFDGTELSIQALSNVTNPEYDHAVANIAKVPLTKYCPSCKRKFPARASFCATDGTELTLALKDGESNSIFDSTVSLKDENGSANGVISTQDLTGKLTGKLLADRYLLESILSEDKGGTLYLAFDRMNERKTTVRILESDAFIDSAVQEAFQKRCQLLTKIDCKNIVALHEVGAIKPQEPYIVAAYEKGQTLLEMLANQGLPPLKVVIDIISQACKGLEAAHQVGIVHQNLRSANIIVQDSSEQADWVKINNFALANYINSPIELGSGIKVSGTPEYMAPEQFKNEVIDARTDLYALGVVIFEILTGTLPFSGDRPETIANKHISEPAPPLIVLRLNLDNDSSVAKIVSKALQKDPEKRFQTASEFRQAVETAFSN
jgi:hypothetical protein